MAHKCKERDVRTGQVVDAETSSRVTAGPRGQPPVGEQECIVARPCTSAAADTFGRGEPLNPEVPASLCVTAGAGALDVTR